MKRESEFTHVRSVLYPAGVRTRPGVDEMIPQLGDRLLHNFTTSDLIRHLTDRQTQQHLVLKRYSLLTWAQMQDSQPSIRTPGLKIPLIMPVVDAVVAVVVVVVVIIVTNTPTQTMLSEAGIVLSVCVCLHYYSCEIKFVRERGVRGGGKLQGSISYFLAARSSQMNVEAANDVDPNC